MIKAKTMTELFNRSSRWTKGEAAKTATGIQVHISDPRAAKFCLVGGVQFCYDWEQQAVVSQTLAQTIRANFKDMRRGRHESEIRLITRFNDKTTRTFKDIKRLVRLANV